MDTNVVAAKPTPDTCAALASGGVPGGGVTYRHRPAEPQPGHATRVGHRPSPPETGRAGPAGLRGQTLPTHTAASSARRAAPPFMHRQAHPNSAGAGCAGPLRRPIADRSTRS